MFDIPTVNIIGAGKLGSTIAKLIYTNNAGTILGICNSNIESSNNAIKFIGTGKPYALIDSLPYSDIAFITVPDDKIKSIVKKFSKNTILPKIAIHCSGLITSDILQPLKDRECIVLSIHPLLSFADPSISCIRFNGTFCTIDGDLKYAKPIEVMFKKLGANIISIDKVNKPIYHAGSVFATNYLVTLAHNAIMCMQLSGIDIEESRNIVFSMMQSTLSNLINTNSPKQALTGPIQRGDIETIKSHIKSMENDKMLNLYKALGASTINLTDHFEDLYNKLSKLLMINKE